MPILAYRVWYMKNNRCRIFLKSVIENRNLYLFSAAIMQQSNVQVTTLTVVFHAKQISSGGQRHQDNLSVKQNTCIFNITSMLSSLYYKTLFWWISNNGKQIFKSILCCMWTLKLLFWHFIYCTYWNTEVFWRHISVLREMQPTIILFYPKWDKHMGVFHPAVCSFKLHWKITEA